MKILFWLGLPLRLVLGIFAFVFVGLVEGRNPVRSWKILLTKGPDHGLD